MDLLICNLIYDYYNIYQKGFNIYYYSKTFDLQKDVELDYDL
jgi:hypothetical protein